MSFKPWKPLLLTALVVGAGTTAATAQKVVAAQKAIELGRYSEARADLRGDSSPDANFELGRVYQMRDLNDSAATYFNKAGGPTPLGMVAEGRALLVKGRAFEAEAKFAEAAKATKNKDASILTKIAQAYAESDVKDTSKGLNYVNLAQTANKGKDNPALMIARGDIYLKSESGGGEAMTSFDRATAADANSAEAYFKKGELNVRSRNGEGAVENFNKAIAIDPNYAPAYYEMASMYASAGQYPKALENFTKYQGVAEKSVTTTQQYAAFLYLSKKYPEALEQVNAALAMEPNNMTMNRLKAYTLYETKDYPAAAAAMDNFLKIAPADKILPDDYSYQSKIMIADNHSAEAIVVLQKAIAAQTDPAKKRDLMSDLVVAYTAQRDYKQAAIMQRQITAAPGSDLTDQFRLGLADIRADEFTRADSVFNIINTAKPDYIPAYQYRARANAGLDPESTKGLAKPYYEKYLTMAAADPTKYQSGIVEANGYLGYYNLKQNDKAAATTYYQKVLELDPTNQDAINAMKIIKGVPRTTTTVKRTVVKKK